MKTNVIELPGGRLAGLSDRQLHGSADLGASGEKVGDPLPLNAQGINYSAKRKAFYVRTMSKKKVGDTVWRWDG